jgi:hypothetical protein
MRPTIAVAAAALTLAVPAAAQPDPEQLLGDAYERAHQNISAEVQDYTLTVAAGPFRREVYVSRNGGSMYVHGLDERGMGAFLLEMVQYPRIGTAYYPEEGVDQTRLAGVEHLGTDTVDGRPVHVLMAPALGVSWNVSDMPDSTRMYVDAQTRQVLRLAVAGTEEPSGRVGPISKGRRTDVSVTYSDYRETDGVTLPRRMRMEMRMRLDVDDAERQALRTQGSDVLTELEAQGGDGAASGAEMIRQLLRMIDGETMVVDAVVEEVRVNAGKPDWVN